MSETWKPVVGYESTHRVSDLGRVENRFGRVLIAATRPDGYCAVPLTLNNHTKRAYVHRLVAEAFHGSAPVGREVAHSDGLRSNNRADNLSWKTRAANHADKRRHGTQQEGEQHGMHRFTNETVLMARTAKAAGEPERAIAARVGVSRWTLRDMLKGRTWNHI